MQIDTGKWASADYSVRLHREDNRKEIVATEIKQVSFFRKTALFMKFFVQIVF